MVEAGKRLAGELIMAQYRFPEKQAKTILLALKEFKFCPALDLDTRYKIKKRLPLRADFPVPELVLFTLRDIKGLEEGAPEEKERWSIYALFRENSLSIRHGQVRRRS